VHVVKSVELICIIAACVALMVVPMVPIRPPVVTPVVTLADLAEVLLEVDLEVLEAQQVLSTLFFQVQLVPFAVL
jgi:hypothetical protein